VETAPALEACGGRHEVGIALHTCGVQVVGEPSERVVDAGDVLAAVVRRLEAVSG
jgi:hypothetical protein